MDLSDSVCVTSRIDAAINESVYTVSLEKVEEIQDMLKQVLAVVNASMDTQLDASLITGLSPSLAVDNSNNYHTFSDMDTMEVNYFSTECDYVKIVFDIRQQYLHN